MICFLFASIFYVLIFNWSLLKIFLCVYSLYLFLTYLYYPYNAPYNSSRKKVALVTWGEPYGPEIYSSLRVRFSNALHFISDAKSISGKHVTPTHLVAKAMAEVLKAFPKLNTKLAFGSLVPYDTVDVSCLVSMDEGSDLGFVCFRSAGEKTVSEIAAESESRVSSVKTGEEKKKFKKAGSPFVLLPTCLGGVLIEVCSWLSVPLGLDLSFIGIQRHPCGPAVITNIGVMGAELIYAPFPTMLRLPVIIVMHTIKDEVVVENGQPAIDKIIDLAITIDHRFVDGQEAMQALDLLKQILEHPQDFLKI